MSQSTDFLEISFLMFYLLINVIKRCYTSEIHRCLFRVIDWIRAEPDTAADIVTICYGASDRDSVACII